MPARLSQLFALLALGATAAFALHVRGWVDVHEVRHWLHFFAGGSLFLCLFAAALQPRRDEAAAPKWADAALFAALLFGVAAAVLAVHGLTFNMLQRLFGESAELPAIELSGAFSIAGLIAALAAWRLARPDPHQPAVAILLSVLLVTWCGLLWPAPGGDYAASAFGAARVETPWWRWIVLVCGAYAVIIFAAAVLHERAIRRTQFAAWPDRIELLLEPVPKWPEFYSAAAVLAATVLLLGTLQIVRGGPPHRGLAIANVAGALLAAVGCFYLAHRRWSANLFGLGAGLITLAAAALATLFIPPRPAATFSVRTPVLLNAVLFGLLFMSFLWFWLARFWKQQLFDGVAWTTAGRAIPYAWRAGFLTAALATLVAYQMVFWPNWPSVLAPDNSPARWIFGLLLLALLTRVTAANAVRANSATLATLSVAAACAIPLFALIRTDNAALRGWVTQYLPIVLAVAALPILAVAEALAETRHRVFGPPLWFLALLILPGLALAGILSSSRAPAEWLRPLTLAAVGGLYGVAGGREGRRAFLLLAAVLLLVAAYMLSRIYVAAVPRGDGL